MPQLIIDYSPLTTQSLTTHEAYMKRCIQLAKLGAGFVAPNPMVGSVLVHENRIIGEGWHQLYGQAHAEVNCINSVKSEDQHLISQSTIYVSLEPCAHFGKTPPCADLIIKNQIPKVAVGCTDSFKEVSGKGIAKLKAAGVEVIQDVLKEECMELNKRFFTFHKKQRPYIILKWAQTANNTIGISPSANDRSEPTRLIISNDYSNRLVHKWRSEEAGILVGTNTALLDNPSLNNRLWHGASPTRLVLDKQLKLPDTLHLFDKKIKTIVLNEVKNEAHENLIFYKIANNTDIAAAITKAAFELNIQSLFVEGGAQLLQAFIQQNLWDEARVITNTKLHVKEGVKAPTLANSTLLEPTYLLNDRIDYFINPTN